MLNSILLLIGITLMYSTPLVFGAMGGMLSEKSGVVNIGIEGMMTIGAFTGASVGYFGGNPWLGFLAAGLAGGIVGLLHAAASITFRANQTVSGIAINLIGAGLATFLCRLFFDGSTMTLPVENKLPKLLNAGEFSLDITVFLAFLTAAFLYVLFYRTKWGLRIRAVGEHPAAADTMGVNVYLTRYACVTAGGILAGFGGASVTLAIIAQYTPTAISGQGFIALAAVIFGKWTPHGVYGACLLFGFAQAVAILAGGTDLIPSEIISMIPYVMTLIILMVFVGKSVAPKANGVAYEKGKR